MARNKDQKVAVVAYALEYNSTQAAKHFNVPYKTVYRWVKEYETDLELKSEVEVTQVDPSPMWLQRTTTTLGLAIESVNERIENDRLKTLPEVQAFKALAQLIKDLHAIRQDSTLLLDLNGVIEEGSLHSKKMGEPVKPVKPIKNITQKALGELTDDQRSLIY